MHGTAHCALYGGTNYDVFLSLKVVLILANSESSIIIWVFTVCQRKRLGVSSIQWGKMSMCPGRLRSVWAFAEIDQSLYCTQWVTMDLSFGHADSKDSDQTQA